MAGSFNILGPQPGPNLPLVDPKSGRLATAWQLYLARLDVALRNAQIGPLTNAANDAAAAAAGVPINGLYRNANAVQIRLV